jgi:hypothetical protein
MGGVISASDPIWIEPFSGLSEPQFRKLVALVRRRGGAIQRGRPWRLCLEDRELLPGRAARRGSRRRYRCRQVGWAEHR